MHEFALAIYCLVAIGVFIELICPLPTQEGKLQIAIEIVVLFILAVLWPVIVGADIAKRYMD